MSSQTDEVILALAWFEPFHCKVTFFQFININMQLNPNIRLCELRSSQF
jgi:hypothetical protein